jgi:hypothetical protein
MIIKHGQNILVSRPCLPPSVKNDFGGVCCLYRVTIRPCNEIAPQLAPTYLQLVIPSAKKRRKGKVRQERAPRPRPPTADTPTTSKKQQLTGHSSQNYIARTATKDQASEKETSSAVVLKLNKKTRQQNTQETTESPRGAK